MKRSSKPPAASRCSRLVALALKNRDDENRGDHELDENDPPPQSPCPVTPSNVDYLNFSKLFDKGHPEHRTPHQEREEKFADCEKPRHRNVLSVQNLNSGNELRSPPKKKVSHTNIGKTSVLSDNAVSARRSLKYENSDVSNSEPPKILSSLALIADYESEDSRSCEQFPSVQAAHSLAEKDTDGFISTISVDVQDSNLFSFTEVADHNNNNGSAFKEYLPDSFPASVQVANSEAKHNTDGFISTISLPDESDSNCFSLTKGADHNSRVQFKESESTAAALSIKSLNSGLNGVSEGDHTLQLAATNSIIKQSSQEKPLVFNSLEFDFHHMTEGDQIRKLLPTGSNVSELETQFEHNELDSAGLGFYSCHFEELSNNTENDYNAFTKLQPAVPVTFMEETSAVIDNESDFINKSLVNTDTSTDGTNFTELHPVSVTAFSYDRSESLVNAFDNANLESDEAVVLPLHPVEGPEVEVNSVENVVDIPREEFIHEENTENPGLHPEPEPPAVNDEDPFPKPRSRNPGRWKQAVIKKLKESGQAHVSLKGKEREAKTMGDGCSATCKRRCHFNISHDDRSAVFQKFYSIENHTTKWYFVANHVKTDDIKRKTVVGPSQRKCTHTYYLPVDGIDKQVCRNFFLETLAISEKFVRTALQKKKLNAGSIPVDGRGKKKKRQAVNIIIREDVMNHIRKYKTIEGHYTRKSSKARYLPEFLNKRMMHSQYLIEKQAEGITENIASLRQYREVFKSEFNLKFFKPKKDQCSKCLSWKNKTPREKTEEALQKYQKHISDKQISQDLKTEDIEFVKKTPDVKDVCVATCDLEKVFLCPKGENSEFYYKSKLSLYNFTIFVSGEQKGFCYVWDQTEARRGSAEISSCLWSFLKMKSEGGVREFRLYSDNCSAQNKNKFLFSMYTMASIRLNIRIVHRYLETGHTHMEVDSVHAAIQNSIKNKEIFVPSEWYAAIKLAKKSLPKYEVNELKQEYIFNFANLASQQIWDKLKTSEFKEVVFDSAEPGIIYYKNQYREDAMKINVIKKRPGHPVNWKTIKLERMYHGRIPLRPIEIRDLTSLCRSGAIPSKYHNYYFNTIINQETVQPDPPHELSEGESFDESDQESSEDSNNTESEED
ncbi:polyprotein [Frankliniella fusca]|uniref:Polyprotein n=1 Tax=Frankliniella fusca TaxID=407009 RepID=A0AAE1LJ48_9NEOP|nr:polyprotein [Frankliniella fusca]